jgi:hypothetical protein
MDTKVRICLSHSPDKSLSVTTDGLSPEAGIAAVSTPTTDLHTLHVAARENLPAVLIIVAFQSFLII